jgi:hypothetical protein
VDLDGLVAHAIRLGMAEQVKRDHDAIVREVLCGYQEYVLREARRIRVFAETRLAAVSN